MAAVSVKRSIVEKKCFFFPDRMKGVKNWNAQNPLGGTGDI